MKKYMISDNGCISVVDLEEDKVQAYLEQLALGWEDPEYECKVQYEECIDSDEPDYYVLLDCWKVDCIELLDHKQYVVTATAVDRLGLV